jgi:hypothetical protein
LKSTLTRQAAEPGFQPVSRWIKAAAYAVPLCVLPSALWRLWALARGLPAGCRPATQPWEPYYITGLSVVSLGAALLTIGLVRPWGELIPRWIPLVGVGRFRSGQPSRRPAWAPPSSSASMPTRC